MHESDSSSHSGNIGFRNITHQMQSNNGIATRPRSAHHHAKDLSAGVHVQVCLVGVCPGRVGS